METAFDIISLVLFIVVILLAFFRKVNVGVVAVTFGVIMVRIFGLTDKDLIDNIIERAHQQRDNTGNGVLPHELADALRSQKLISGIHKHHLSFPKIRNA